MDPTTLVANLKPLEREGRLASATAEDAAWDCDRDRGRRANAA
jgi:hypothetical protein